MFPRLVRWSLFSILVLTLFLACRTTDLLTGTYVPPASEIVARNRVRVTETPQALSLQVPTDRPARDPLATNVPTVFVPPPEHPTDTPFPTDPPPPPATDIPQATDILPPTTRPQATVPPTAAGPTPTVGPTRCPQTYCVSFRGCQTDGNTIIEGIVYNNGVPENGVAVRVAKEQGAYPLVDDFISGYDPINPGHPDPKNPGHYILQIVAGSPREGNWWVFVIDKPNGTKQMSEAKLIHTNDDASNPGNCQHAFVDFVR